MVEAIPPGRFESPQPEVTDQQILDLYEASEAAKKASDKFVLLRFMEGMASKLGDHPLRNIALAALAGFSPQVVDLANQAIGQIHELKELHDSDAIYTLHESAKVFSGEVLPTVLGAYFGKAVGFFRRRDAGHERRQVMQAIDEKNGSITAQELAPLFHHGKPVLTEEIKIWIDEGVKRNNKRDPRAKVITQLFKARKSGMVDRTDSEAMKDAKRETMNLVKEAQMLGLLERTDPQSLNQEGEMEQRDVVSGAATGLALGLGLELAVGPEGPGFLGFGDEAFFLGAVAAKTIEEFWHKGKERPEVISNRKRPGVSEDQSLRARLSKVIRIK